MDIAISRNPLPILSDLGIITIGIAAYRISEMELDHMFDGIGFLGVPNRVSMFTFSFSLLYPLAVSLGG